MEKWEKLEQRLTTQEWDVLGFMSMGLNNMGITERLNIKNKRKILPHTIQGIISRIYGKLFIPSTEQHSARVEAVLIYIKYMMSEGRVK